MKWQAPACLLAALAAGCAIAPERAASLLPAAQMQGPPERMIVIAVANPAQPVAPRAGSTMRGYDAMPRYAVSGAARAALAGLTADYRLRQLAAWPIAPLELHCAVFEIPAQSSRDALLRALQQDPRVRLAQPLQTFATLAQGYNDPYVGLQRGFQSIRAAQAQQWTRGDGVRVAIVDTGLDAAHPDLKDRVAAQRNFVDGDARQFLADRHGTGVAGVIAAVANNREGIVGVAPDVQLLALKACWESGSPAGAAQCNSFTLAQAIAAAIEARAQILNLSLAGPADPLLAALLAYGLARGVIVVGALPRGGAVDGFPAGVPGVIAVDVDGAGGGDPPGNVLRAPGRDILTLTPGGHYDFASGSSLAAAHVSGTLALLLAQSPRLDAAAALALLRRTSLHLADGGASIDACAAIAALRAGGACASAPLRAAQPAAASFSQGTQTR